MINTNNFSNPADHIGSLKADSNPAPAENRRKKSNAEGRGPLEQRATIRELLVRRTVAAIKTTNPALVERIEMPQQFTDIGVQVGHMVGPAVFESPYVTDVSAPASMAPIVPASQTPASRIDTDRMVDADISSTVAELAQAVVSLPPAVHTAAQAAVPAEALPIVPVAVHDNDSFLAAARDQVADSHVLEAGHYTDNHPRLEAPAVSSQQPAEGSEVMRDVYQFPAPDSSLSDLPATADDGMITTYQRQDAA